VDTKKLEWLPMTETSSSFYIFTTADGGSEVERKELELWILGNIKQSNLGGHGLKDWVLDLTLKDAVSYAFDVLITSGPYQAPSKRNPNYFSTLRLKSKLKKHQTYMSTDELTVFPQLYDARQLNSATTVRGDGMFPPENFADGASVAVECTVMGYQMGAAEGYSVNILAVHLIASAEESSTPMTPRKRSKTLIFSSPNRAGQAFEK